MFKFIDFIRSLDKFGEPISLNYKGETSFKTVLGATFSIALNLFIMVYAFGQILVLANYEDPQISTYTIYQPRNQNDTINMAETYGNILIAIENQADFSTAMFDPRYLTITAKILTGNNHILNPGGDTVMDLELDFASLDKHPAIFESYAKNYLSEDGVSNLLVLKDPSKVNLVDNFFESNQAEQLVIQIHKCDKKTSSVKCASDREIDEYMKN